MWKRLVLLLAFSLCLCASATRAQVVSLGPCSVVIRFNHSFVGIGASNVACTLPQLYGAGGLIFGGNAGPLLHSADFPGAAIQQDFLTSINTNVASQIALLPFVTPASGIS